MTVIATKIEEDRIILGSDSQTTTGESYKSTSQSKDSQFKKASKIFNTNGMSIACAGAVKGNLFMQVFAQNHKPKNASEEAVMEFLVEFQSWTKGKDSNYKVEDNNFIIVMIAEKRVFQVVDGFLVREVHKYTAIGSGMFLALGALFHGHSIEEAIEAAKEFDLFCGGETIIKEFSY